MVNFLCIPFRGGRARRWWRREEPYREEGGNSWGGKGAVYSGVGGQVYLTESAYKIVVKKSIPAQIRQVILHISNDKDSVDGFVRELIFAKRRYKPFM